MSGAHRALNDSCFLLPSVNDLLVLQLEARLPDLQ